jgi:hypothetical protein
MKILVIYLVIGLINSGIGIWTQRECLKKEFDLWCVLGILLGITLWPVMNILSFIEAIKSR